MKKISWLVLLLIALACFGLACDNGDDDDDNNDVAADDDNDDNDDDNDNDNDDDDTPPTLINTYTYELKLETDFTAALEVKQYDDGSLEGVFTPNDGFNVLAAGVTLTGTGKTWAFPEAGGRMISLKMTGEPFDGRCGANRVSYALALTAKGDNNYVVGGITARCGADNFNGTAVRVMRLTGPRQIAE